MSMAEDRRKTKGSLSTQIDPATLMRIKNLQLRAKAVVDGFYNGLHRSPLHGFSVEFSEYRPYTEGDDPRGIDWRLYARSDRYYIKKFEDETNRRCYLAVDQSKSMQYGSTGYTKCEYARTLAATLAYYFHLQRDAVGCLTFESALIDFIPARHRPGQLQRLMSALQSEPRGASTNLLGPLELLADILHHRGLIILISDFLVPLEQLEQRFAFLRARRHELIVLRVLDPTEVDLPGNEPMTLVDSETGRKIFVDPVRERDAYKQRFTQHQNQLSEMLASHGIDFATLLTNEPLDQALFQVLHAQIHRNAMGGRVRGSGRRPVSS
jgi:uncharacterized protein (DUF58 family)